MKSGNHTGPGQLLCDGAEIAQAPRDGIGRSGDYRWEETCDAGLQNRLRGEGKIGHRHRRIVEIDSGKTIDLQVKKSGTNHLQFGLSTTLPQVWNIRAL
jgi:hypothetical protein